MQETGTINTGRKEVVTVNKLTGHGAVENWSHFPFSHQLLWLIYFRALQSLEFNVRMAGLTLP
jgi:hypothetical protein